MCSEHTELEINILSEAKQYLLEAEHYTKNNAACQKAVAELGTTDKDLSIHSFRYNYNACETLCGLARLKNHGFSPKIEAELEKIYDDLLKLNSY